MITGNGDLASVLGPFEREDRTYFASGVSNSSEIRNSEFAREITLLLKQDRSKHLIYFSSLCIFFSKTPYAEHKRAMEEIVKKTFGRYTIFRVGNILWGSNPHTLINFLKGKIERGEPYEVQDVYRYVIDKEEFIHWIGMIPPWPAEMNVPGRRMKVQEIVNEYCLSKDYLRQMKYQFGERLSFTWGS